MLESLRKMVLTDTIRVALGLPPVAGGFLGEPVDGEAEADRCEDGLRRLALDIIHFGDGSAL